jgi:hypothetical protein
MKLKWQQAPVKTQWGDEMVVASVAIDNDHTLSLYCERDQTPKVDAMLAQRKPLTDERIESVRHVRDVQGYDGNWNYDPYMQGLYNGLEFALSLIEVREPQFKDAPETWLGDIKVKYKLSSRSQTEAQK